MKCKDCNNFECSYRNTLEKCFYQDDYLDEDFNWKSFRAETAKEFTAALIHVIDWEATPNEVIVKNAIDLTNELIKQLKEKEE